MMFSRLLLVHLDERDMVSAGEDKAVAVLNAIANIEKMGWREMMTLFLRHRIACITG